MNLITLEEPDRSWDQFASAHSSLIFHSSVWGRVLKQGKEKKAIVFKYKPKTRYKKKAGHRQLFTEVEITKIET